MFLLLQYKEYSFLVKFGSSSSCIPFSRQICGLALPPPAFQTSQHPGPTETADGGSSADQPTLGVMDRDQVGLTDSLLLKLRASVKTSRKQVDDLILEVGEQIETIPA